MLSMANTWQLLANPTTITYHQRTGSGTFAAGVQVDYAFKTAVERDAQALTEYGQLASGQSTFHLWRAKLGGIIPKANDVIEDDEGVRWMVYGVTNAARDTTGVQRYRCLVTREWPSS